MPAAPEPPWDRHAEPPEHGGPGDPHLFFVTDVEAGAREAARPFGRTMYRGCVFCGVRFDVTEYFREQAAQREKAPSRESGEGLR